MDRLAELRERRALTLRELAGISGVAADTINQIELGHRKARPSTLRKLAKALDVEVRELFEEPVPLGEAPREAGQPEGNKETPEAQRSLSAQAPEARAEGGAATAAAAAIKEALAAAREETLREIEEQDALLGKHMALLLEQQLEWQLERLNSRLDRAESAAARNDAARDLGNWFFVTTLWIEQVRRHYPEVWVPELVRAREAARVAVEEFAPNFTSPESHEETTRRLAGIEAATAAQDTPPTGPSRRVRFSGGPSWGEPAADPTEAEAPTKGS